MSGPTPIDKVIEELTIIYSLTCSIDQPQGYRLGEIQQHAGSALRSLGKDPIPPLRHGEG